MMRNLTVFSVLVLFVVGCKPTTELNNEEAMNLLKTNFAQDSVYYTDISTHDERVLAKPQMDTLERIGLVSLKRRYSLFDVGTPLIFLTTKGERFRLHTEASDTTERRLRVADTKISGIKSIRYFDVNGVKKAHIMYVMDYLNVTPFSILEKGDFNKPQIKSATFSWAGGAWELED